MARSLGKKPSGERLKRISESDNFRDGKFQNIHRTPETLEGTSYFRMICEFLNKPKDTAPAKPIPSIKTDISKLKSEKPQLIWFGHSSYLISAAGKNILVDPVMSGNASPVKFFGKSFPGSDAYTAEQLPEIDLLVITHDHYDHLDYKTIIKLRKKVKQVVTSLGVGSHLEHWGIPAEKITELDWWETAAIEGMSVTACPARHFSGRVQRATTLWSSFALEVAGMHIYLGGDSGYDTHFKSIGNKYGPFDLAILENGQYGKDWPYIHMFPEQVIQAAEDLNTKVLLPVHWAKFSLALHPWTEPIDHLLSSHKDHEFRIITPMIGELFSIGEDFPDKKWWKD